VVDDYTVDVVCQVSCPIYPKTAFFTRFQAPAWHKAASEAEQVEITLGAGGARGQSQRNAAEGVPGRRRVLRRTVPGTPRTTPIEAVQAALQRDPISMAYRNGGVLLHE
jgi:hypothetical protein